MENDISRRIMNSKDIKCECNCYPNFDFDFRFDFADQIINKRTFISCLSFDVGGAEIGRLVMRPKKLCVCCCSLTSPDGVDAVGSKCLSMLT